ncbi:hypothetical protein AAY473_015060 [Plecturocebus cupreus]
MEHAVHTHTAEWARTALGPRLRIHPSCLSAESRLPEHLSLGRLEWLQASSGDARGLEGEGVHGAPTRPWLFPSLLQFQPKARLPWVPRGSARVMGDPKPVETVLVPLPGPQQTRRGHRPYLERGRWPCGLVLRLFSHSGGLWAFSSTQKGHSASPPCAPSRRGCPPQACVFTHVPSSAFAVMGEKSPPETCGGPRVDTACCCVLLAWLLPVASVGRGEAVAGRPLLKNPQSSCCGKGQATRILSSPPTQGCALLIWGRSPRLRPSLPALCVRLAELRSLPITGSLLENAVPRGRTRPRQQLPTPQQKRQDGRRPLTQARSRQRTPPLLWENVDFVGARDRGTDTWL